MSESHTHNQLEEGLDLMLQFDKRGGLLPVIVQNSSDGRILMLGYADQQAVAMTLETGHAAFFSTSRKTHWIKGETSGDRLEVEELLVDCDQDALVYRVRMLGSGVCHTKKPDGSSRSSCFYRRLRPGQPVLEFVPERDAQG